MAVKSRSYPYSWSWLCEVVIGNFFSKLFNGELFSPAFRIYLYFCQRNTHQKAANFVRDCWALPTQLKSQKYQNPRCTIFHKNPYEIVGQFSFNNCFTHFREKLVWKSGHFHKTCFLGKLLLLIHLHFNPVIKFHIDEDDTFISASTKYELNWKRVLLDGSVCLTSHDLQTSVTMWTICSYSLSPSKVLW